jgi:hypothetical protein
LIAVAIALVVVQTFVAGLASAQSASISGSEALGVICHGTGGAEPPAGSAPPFGKARDICCAFCAAAPPAVLPVTPPAIGRVEHAGDDGLPATAHDIVLIAKRAVRAGPSQAPPSFV